MLALVDKVSDDGEDTYTVEVKFVEDLVGIIKNFDSPIILKQPWDKEAEHELEITIYDYWIE